MRVHGRRATGYEKGLRGIRLDLQEIFSDVIGFCLLLAKLVETLSPRLRGRCRILRDLDYITLIKLPIATAQRGAQQRMIKSFEFLRSENALMLRVKLYVLAIIRLCSA